MSVMDNNPDPADGLIDYYASKARFTGKVWRVSFQEEEAFTETAPIDELEDVMKKAGGSVKRALDDLTAAAFSGKLNSEPAPETCQGNQHVFKLGAQYCLCGKVKDE